jgi:hypothetical protein
MPPLCGSEGDTRRPSVAVEESLADGLVPPVRETLPDRVTAVVETATDHLYLLSGVTVND